MSTLYATNKQCETKSMSADRNTLRNNSRNNALRQKGLMRHKRLNSNGVKLIMCSKLRQHLKQQHVATNEPESGRLIACYCKQFYTHRWKRNIDIQRGFDRINKVQWLGANGRCFLSNKLSQSSQFSVTATIIHVIIGCEPKRRYNCNWKTTTLIHHLGERWP